MKVELLRVKIYQRPENMFIVWNVESGSNHEIGKFNEETMNCPLKFQLEEMDKSLNL